jgi:excisionase family DNA binding protein
MNDQEDTIQTSAETSDARPMPEAQSYESEAQRMLLGSSAPMSILESNAHITKGDLNSGSVRLAFSVKEAAALLGVSEKTLRRLIKRKLLRASNALRHLLISRRELERFLHETSS